jgi:hypothetical protein
MNEEMKKEGDLGGLFKMDFSTFILSLNASALIHLGEIPDPHSKERSINLPAAKHTIEILEILKNKTKGNLDREEDKLLDDVLYNLRMKYVKDVQPEKK